MNTKLDLIDTTQPFLGYLEEWYAELSQLPLSTVLGSEPDRFALIAIDVINGFCKHGPLASDRVGRIVRPVADLFQRAYDLGVRNFVLTQDAHDPSAPEFAAYPPHCLRGSAESETVDELKA